MMDAFLGKTAPANGTSTCKAETYMIGSFPRIGVSSVFEFDSASRFASTFWRASASGFASTFLCDSDSGLTSALCCASGLVLGSDRLPGLLPEIDQ